MIIGTGIDIVEIIRFENMFKKHGKRFIGKYFTVTEALCSKNKINFFAGRFAVKEAISKAFGLGFGKHLKWRDLEILPDKYGKPILTKNSILINLLQSDFECHISISHEKKYVVAHAILLKI